MSGPSIVAQLDLLEGKKFVGETLSRQFIFQSGRRTFYCIPQAMSVSTPMDVHKFNAVAILGANAQDIAAYAAGNPSTFQDYYMWANQTEIHMQNHSGQPIYVTAHYLQSRELIAVHPTQPAMLPDIHTAANYSHIIDDIVKGLKLTTENTDTDINKPFGANDAGYWGGKVDDTVLIDLGEGAGIAGDGELKNFRETALAPNYGVSIPFNYSIYDSPNFVNRYKIYHTKKFVLGPECQAHLDLDDKQLKVIQFPTANTSEIGEWDEAAALCNRFSKFIMLEIEGSLTGADPFVGLTFNDAETDNVNLNSNMSKVSTHGGVVRLKITRKFRQGSFTNAPYRLLQNHHLYSMDSPGYVPDDIFTNIGHVDIHNHD